MPQQPIPKPAEEHCTSYVYYSYEEWGRGYIGSRTAKGCYPGDAYFGSFRDPAFHPVSKIILFEGTAEECLEVEVKLHAFFDVACNPHFANKARQTSTGFSTTGTTQDEEWKRKAMVGLRNPANAQRGHIASAKTNREIKTNAYFNPEHQARARKLAVKANKERGTGCAYSQEWQNQRRLKHGWSPELWADLEAGLASGKRFWGKQNVMAKHGISLSTASAIVAHLQAGRTWNSLFGSG